MSAPSPATTEPIHLENRTGAYYRFIKQKREEKYGSRHTGEGMVLSLGLNAAKATNGNGARSALTIHEYQKGTAQGLRSYLGTVTRAGDITEETASRALRTWEKLSEATDKQLPIPDASTGPDGQLLYTWNKDEHHLELEVFPAGPAEFFYYNRSSEEAWEEEYTVGNSISQDAKSRLDVFIS